MALSNFTELKSTIADFLNRDDLTAIIPAFIEMAEAQMNRDLRHWRMEKRSVGDVDSEYSALPSDWIETISLHVNGDGTSTLNLQSREAVANRRAKTEDETGRPTLYTHAAGSIELFPTPDKTYEIELLYYAKIDALSSSTATNWLLDEAPDVYFVRALIHSAPYLQEDARAGTWASMYSAAVQKLNSASDAAKMSGTGLRLNVRGLG